MKTTTLRMLTLAGLLGFAALATSALALAHDGHRYGHDHRGGRHFIHPGYRVVVVRPPIIVHRRVVVYRPARVYYPAPAPVYYAAPAPVYYAQPALSVVGGALAGAVIGGAIGDGRPGAIAAGSVIGAAVGGSFIH